MIFYRTPTFRMENNLLLTPLPRECVEKNWSSLSRVEPHLYTIPPAINLVVIVLWPLSIASQKHKGKIEFATTISLSSNTTTIKITFKQQLNYQQARPNKLSIPCSQNHTPIIGVLASYVNKIEIYTNMRMNSNEFEDLRLKTRKYWIICETQAQILWFEILLNL